MWEREWVGVGEWVWGRERGIERAWDRAWREWVWERECGRECVGE